MVQIWIADLIFGEIPCRFTIKLIASPVLFFLIQQHDPLGRVAVDAQIAFLRKLRNSSAAGELI